MADLFFYQAEILEMAGQRDAAATALIEAADAATRKGSLIDVRRAKEKLAALTASEGAA